MNHELYVIKVLNPVPCGFPSPAMDYMEDRISLDKEYIKNPLSTYLFEASGLSMINAFVPPGAKLLVDRSVTPRNSDIVVATLEGEYVVKYLKKNDFKCWLVPANSKFQEIEVTEEMNMVVFGVVTAIIIDPNSTRSCML